LLTLSGIHGKRFKKIYLAVFKIFEKVLKIENCSKFIMEVMLRKSLVLEIKKTQTNKTFMASKQNFKAHFGVFCSNFIKMVFSVQFIYILLNKKHGLKCFRDLFEIKHTEFFLFLLILFAIHCNFRIWHQLFYKRFGSNKIRALPSFIFLVYRFHGNIDYLKKHIQPNSNPLPKTGVIFTSIKLREGW